MSVSDWRPLNYRDLNAVRTWVDECVHFLKFRPRSNFQKFARVICRKNGEIIDLTNFLVMDFQFSFFDGPPVIFAAWEIWSPR